MGPANNTARVQAPVPRTPICYTLSDSRGCVTVSLFRLCGAMKRLHRGSQLVHMTQLGIYNTCAGLNTAILVWTALPDGSNTARAHVYGRTDISKISNERYVCDHIQHARTGPVAAPRTPSITTMDSATRTYMKITTFDARASPKRPKTHALVTVRTAEQSANHGPARASPPARDAVEHGPGTPPTH